MFSTKQNLGAVPGSSLKVKMPPASERTASTAASTLISLAVAGLAVASCLFSSSSSGTFKGQLVAVASWFHQNSKNADSKRPENTVYGEMDQS